MRILHGADVHIGYEVPGYPTANAEALSRFVQTAIERDVDLAIWSGDTFHSRRPTPTQLRTAVRAAVDLRDARIPLVIGTGNHDGYSEIGEPDSHVLGWWRDLGVDGVTVLIDAETARVETKHGETLLVAHLPYPHKRLFAGDDGSLAERIRLTAEYAAERLATLGADKPDLLVAHLSIEGALIGGESAMRMGWDATILPEALAPFGYAALGHIHRQQRIADNAWYAGAPVAMGWTSALDAGDGWLEVELSTPPVVRSLPGGGPVWIRIELREEDDWSLPEIPFGSVVKAVLHPNGRLSADVGRRVIDGLTERGAGYVRLEVVRASHRLPPDAPQTVDLEPFDLESLMRDWLASRGIAADEPMRVAREVVHSVRNSGGPG